MAPDVKRSTRTYDASRRQEQARARRRTVVSAARELLEQRGYAGTSIADVARRAGVSPESIYKGFGGKAALVKAVVDVALAGDDEPVAVPDRAEAQRVRSEPDVATKLRRYAADAAVRIARSARVQLVLREGAAADPAVAELWKVLQTERLTGMTMLATHLLATGELRRDVTVGEARDVLWTCISVEIYDLFVLQRGWSDAAYTDWLARALVAALL